MYIFPNHCLRTRQNKKLSHENYEIKSTKRKFANHELTIQPYVELKFLDIDYGTRKFLELRTKVVD